jgi:hypothetical protein
LFGLLFNPKDGKLRVPLKRRLTFNGLHGVICQKGRLYSNRENPKFYKLEKVLKSVIVTKTRHITQNIELINTDRVFWCVSI